MKEQSGARRRSNKNPTTEKTTGGISDNNNARQQVSILYKIAQRRTSPCLSKPPGARRRLTMATMGDEWSYSVRGEDDELEVSLKLFTASHDANTNAAFPTVTARPLVRSRPEDDVEDHSRYEKASRAVVPPKATIPKEVEKPKSSPVKVSQAQENDVIFKSTAMGIRLKRGEDGFVRVVSVTEATIGSSIVRDGTIEPEDRILEAAGIDLRSSITNSQWGDTVAKIRSAPRPMKFVVACGPRRQNPVISSRSAGVQQNRPVGQSRASKLYGSALRPISSHQAGSDGSYRESDAVKTVASTVDDESTHTSEQPKGSFFRRTACPSPVTACAVPNQSQHTDRGGGSQVPIGWDGGHGSPDTSIDYDNIEVSYGEHRWADEAGTIKTNLNASETTDEITLASEGSSYEDEGFGRSQYMRRVRRRRNIFIFCTFLTFVASAIPFALLLAKQGRLVNREAELASANPPAVSSIQGDGAVDEIVEEQSRDEPHQNEEDDDTRNDGADSDSQNVYQAETIGPSLMSSDVPSAPPSSTSSFAPSLEPTSPPTRDPTTR